MLRNMWRALRGGGSGSRGASSSGGGADHAADPAEVDPAEAAARQRDGAVLLDVREDAEWRDGHAPGALHVPLDRVADEAGSLAGRPVLAICRSGNRSGRAARLLAARGVEVVNVRGGMLAWAEAGLPVVRGEDG